MINLREKYITVIGARRSGVGAARLIQKQGGIPFVSDSAPEEKLTPFLPALNEKNIAFETGGHSDKVYDSSMMVVSPGVPSDADVITKAKEKNIKVISELELASWFCKGKIIGITGTNGKTTTTSLCDYLFNYCGIKSYAAGNIGLAFSEIADQVKENEVVSLEISSFQLDLMDTFKPWIGMILNITPDHLNRYNNKFENYISSKLNIYKNQDVSDILIINKDSEPLRLVKENKSRSFFFSLKEEIPSGAFLRSGEIIYDEDGIEKFRMPVKDIYIQGEHNYANAMAVIIAAKQFGLENDKIKEALKRFEGVEHRLEFVREIEGVRFINDSKATNVDSVWYALRSYENPLFLILGGEDKGNDYNQVKGLIQKKVKKIYAIGSSAETIFNFFHSSVKVEIKKTLEEAVNASSREARNGDIVLLSPACASFDMFDNYEHRGKVFKKAVNKL